MSGDLSKMSVVQWFDEAEKHRCGYCKNTSGSISNGMWADTLMVDDYQNLIDRGWRRSGKYCYKPIMDETCCPQYTIKCEVLHFTLSKSQKKVIKKFNKFLEDGILNKTHVPSESFSCGEGDSQEHTQIFNKTPQKINLNEVVGISSTSALATGEPQEIQIQENTTQQLQDISSAQKHIKTTHRGLGIDSSKPPCKKAKFLRLERKKEKLLSKGITIEHKEPVQHQKSIEQFFEDIPGSYSKKLKLVLVPSSEPNSEWEKTKQTEFDLYRKYQMIIHNDPPEKLSMRGFCRFLVNSPLKPEDFPEGVDGPGYGSFHQQYWLEDKLIAVGVIDILPRSISSVYFFYDPDYTSLSLGMYSSLREVHFTRSIQKQLPDLNSYYMGFYIHSCPKMRYKGKLTPSYLLCPETYSWIPIEKCVVVLDREKYSRLNGDIDAIDENVPDEKDIMGIKIIYKYKLMYFKDFKRYCKQPALFSKIGSLVGKKCTKTIVFWIS